MGVFFFILKWAIVSLLIIKNSLFKNSHRSSALQEICKWNCLREISFMLSLDRDSFRICNLVLCLALEEFVQQPVNGAGSIEWAEEPLLECSRDTSTVSKSRWVLLAGHCRLWYSRNYSEIQGWKKLSKKGSKGWHDLGFGTGKKGKYLVRTVGVFRGFSPTDFQWEVYVWIFCDELGMPVVLKWI